MEVYLVLSSGLDPPGAQHCCLVRYSCHIVTWQRTRGERVSMLALVPNSFEATNATTGSLTLMTQSQLPPKITPPNLLTHEL